MNAPVDVLAWIDDRVAKERELERATGLRSEAREKAVIVYHAVAELIEAGKEIPAMSVLSDCNCETCTAIARFNAALAGVGSAA